MTYKWTVNKHGSKMAQMDHLDFAGEVSNQITYYNDNKSYLANRLHKLIVIRKTCLFFFWKEHASNT